MASNPKLNRDRTMVGSEDGGVDFGFGDFWDEFFGDEKVVSPPADISRALSKKPYTSLT